MTSACRRLYAPAALIFALLISGSLSSNIWAQANVTGQWRTLPTTMPINPVHLALMHNGKVLIVSGSGNLPSETNYMGAVWDPATDTLTTQPLGWDMFCNGMIVLPDGRPFIMSGTRQYDPFHGELRTSTYDPATGKFVDMQPMAHGRWYPTATTLADGSVMVFSGLDENGSTNTTVEFYKVASGWSQPFGGPWTPPLYPRMHLLPNGTVFYSGSSANSAIFNPANRTWTTNVATTRYSGTRSYGTSVLLPLMPASGYKPKVMIFGGGDPATATTELIDLSVTSPSWVFGPSMSQPRIEMDATILPNGKVIALGGSTNDEDTATASLNADLYDPNTNTFSSAAANAFPRLYHSNSLLLPDATVLVLGGNPQRGTYEQHMEIYSPAYLFNPDGTLAARPSITGVTPGVIGWGSAFQVQTPNAASIASAVLVRAGAVTHAFDMDQRLVGLTFTAGSGVLNVTAPPNGNIAPPGYYLLFILNSAGVPSMASFVQISTAPNDQPPTATITSPSSDLTIAGGQSVNFSGTGTDTDGTITAYSWVFPGGNPGGSSLANPGAVTYSAPGTYVASFNVTDNAGLTDPSPKTRTVTVVPSFSLSSAPAVRTVAPGGGASFTVTVSPGTGFSGTVSFSVSGLPSTATAAFNPTTVTTSGSTTLTVSTTSSTPVGNYPLTISGSSGGLTVTSTPALVVNSSGVGGIQFVQVNSATPHGSQAQVTLPFTAVQTAGDLNVVVVGWNDSSGAVSSVTDTARNTYTLAVGPTAVSGTLSQSIYYAKNIVAAGAGANTVTVNFSPAANSPDIRILEYSGLDPNNPLDASMGATGNSSTSDSGPATTTNANDLLFGANTVFTGNAAAGAGYTARIITVPDSDLAEDEVVTAASTYHATAQLTGAGPWVMQVVALKPAGAAPTPTAPSNLTVTAISSTQINLSWTASTETGGTISQYLVERCLAASCTFSQVGTSGTTTFSDPGLTGSTAYTYRVRAMDTSSRTGPYSNTATATTAPPTITAPTNLTATPASSTQINLSWTAATETGGTISKYLVEHCQGSSCSNFVQFASPSGTSINDTGLLAGTTYNYRVRATDAAGDLGPYSSTATATTPSGPPPPAISFVQVNSATPHGSNAQVTVSYTLAQTAGDLNIVVVGWNDSIGAVSSVTDTAVNSYILAVGPTAVSGTLTQSIYYAKNIASAAAGANTVTVKFSPSANIPDIRILEYAGLDRNNPLDATSTATGNSATGDSGPATTTNANDLLFGANTVFTGNAAAGAGYTSRIITVPDSDLAEDQVVTAANTYHATAKLTSTGAWVMQLASFRAAPPDSTPPTAPTNLTSTPASSTQINLTWTASTDNVGVAGYLLERCLGTTCNSFTQIATPGGTAFNDTTVAPATGYSYRVRATDAAGNLSGYSNVATATTPPDTTPPTAPSNLIATASSITQINLTWTASTDNVGVSNYLLERCQGTSCNNFVQIATPTAPSFADSGLTSGTSYSYRVRATDAAGNLSGYSNIAGASTPVPGQPPTAPANLAATAISNTQINLTWTASTSASGVTGYKVERCQGSSCTSFAQISAPGGTAFSDTTLLAATPYSYRVRATDGSGNLSNYSNTASATTLAVAPPAPLGIVQVNSATPQSPTLQVAVAYTLAQNAGDLNVVVVGWNDTTAAVSSVMDTAGNIYILAVGPTAVSGKLSQSIYYLKNIVAAGAGANTVTVKFSVAASFPDIRILEYSGLDPNNPLDASMGATGNSSTSDSGPATTTNANDLLFGANTVFTGNVAPGAGYTARIITTPDSDLAEDQVVTATATYHATATLSGSGPWVMQLVAFRASTPGLSISPRATALTPARTQQFAASGGGVTWSVNGIAGGSASVGTISASGLYTPPAAVGAYTVQATTTGAPAQSAASTVYVTTYPGTFTYHNDAARTGQNLSETVLTTTVVTQTQFGKQFSCAVDGQVYTQPLYIANLSIGSVIHNVVFVATQNDSVYAFDADNLNCSQLWRASLLDFNHGAASGATAVPVGDTGETGDITPVIGITGTPVIDPGSNTLYVVSKTKEGANYHQRLHALSLVDGTEKFSGPVEIQASVPGSGAGSSGGSVAFSPLRENQRPALLLLNGNVYIAWASHGDVPPYHGWVIGYSASTLMQTGIFITTPNGSDGGIWQTGDGPAADSNGNIYVAVGNGTFDTSAAIPPVAPNNDFGISAIKLSTASGLAIADFFTPLNFTNLDTNDFDLGSGGPVVLPDSVGSSAHPHLVVNGDKEGNLYLLDRDKMGGFCSSCTTTNTNIVQQLNAAATGNCITCGFFETPAIWGGRLYIQPIKDVLKSFTISNAQISTSPVSQSGQIFGYPGATPAISALGASNGIVWVIDASTNGTNGAANGPAVLHAYDALNLASELWNSSQASGGRDTAGNAVKFTVPTVANGKVFIGTQSGLTVYGLLP
jgi:chitodextrinase